MFKKKIYLVEFLNGRFGVMRKTWWGGSEFLSRTYDYWYKYAHNTEEIRDFCQFSSKRQAMEKMKTSENTQKPNWRIVQLPSLEDLL